MILSYFLLILQKKKLLRLQRKKNIAMAHEQSSVNTRQSYQLKEPRRFKVVIHNDDFTTMEFVVKVLMTVFFKTEEEATALMLVVHHSEKAVVGVYSFDIAASKSEKAIEMAREEGFPLRLTVEPE